MSHSLRVARHVLLFARVKYRFWLLVLLVACSESSPMPDRPQLEVASFPAVESTQVDVLLLVDNSGSTSHWQERLGLAMPAFLSALDDVDLRIGVVTSDMGTTGSLSPTNPAPQVGTVGNGGCAEDGDGGILRTMLDTNALTPAAVSAALRVGSTGCGFEQHLHAIRRARQTNPTFWRADTPTAVIALVDEDDCSARDPRLFEASTTTLGRQDSFRCTTQGIVCDEPLDTVGPKTNCRPATASQYIEDPVITKDALEAAAPTTFSVLAGPPTPFAIEERQQGGVSVRALAHTCPGDGVVGEAADPAVRLASLVESFGSRGGFYPVCQPSYDAVVQQVAKTIQRSLGVACLADTVADLDLASCVATDVTATARTPLVRCPSSTDCFDIVSDTARCAGGLRVIVDRKSTPDPTTRVEVACARP